MEDQSDPIFDPQEEDNSVAAYRLPSSSSERPIAGENEGSRATKEGPSNLATWDAWHYYWGKALAAFGNWNNRQILKSVDASPLVLRTYHDSFLFGEVPLSVKAKTTLRSGVMGTAWHMVEFFLALLSGGLYIYYTYHREHTHDWLFLMQNAISMAFFADYVLRVYSEPVRLYFIFSVWGIVDLVTTLPIILVFRYDITGADFIRLLQFVRIVRISGLIYKVGLFGGSVMQQIFLLTIATFGVGTALPWSHIFQPIFEFCRVLLDAGILHWVEYHLAPESVKATCTEQGCIAFGESLYFLIVTMSTVGYGDVTPKTAVGQLVAIISIIMSLTILPIQAARITSLAFRRPYGGSFSAQKIVGSRFLIISGSVTFAALQNFLAEFYNPTHCEGGARLHYTGVIEKRCVDLLVGLPDLEVYPLRVVILAPFSPSFEFKQILSLYNGLVEFIEGSPVQQSDLERVSADRATAFFLLADNNVENYQVEDAAQVVRALAVHRYCRANQYLQTVRIILEVLDPETHTSAVWDEAHMKGIEVICPVKVHYRMMARSCAVHGLYTLITNLFTSELQLKYLKRKHFLTEYFHSFDNEVYPVVFPSAFHNRSFEEVAEFLFVKFRSIFFAVDTVVGYTANGQLDRKVLLYPRRHRILPEDVGLIISTDLHIVYAISTYQPDDQKPGYLHNLWVWATTVPTIRRHNQGTELLDPTSGKWRRSTTLVSRTTQVESEKAERCGLFSPNSGHGKLEYELKSAIRSSASAQNYVHNLGDHQTAVQEVGILQGLDLEAPQLESNTSPQRRTSGRQFPKGKSLLKAAEELLAWPPTNLNDKPHPAVLEEKEDVIKKDLESKTISMVAFNTPHILVCCQSGWPSNLFYFLLQLRKPGFHNPPVVVLYPSEVTVRQWGAVGAFPDVYFFKGSPCNELDLLRAGVLQAGKVVVLSDQGVPLDLGGGSDTNKYLKRQPAAYTSDVENIVIAATVQRLYGHDRTDNVIVEMQQPEAFFYLRPQYTISQAHFPRVDVRRNQEALVHFVPPFMAGKAVSATMLGFLMRSAFYNRNTQSIVDQLINGGHSMTEDGLQEDPPIILDQIALPEGYSNRPYSDLFLGLLREKELLAIGLYRVQGTLGAPTSYVLTNPLSNYIVNLDDLVYVLR